MRHARKAFNRRGNDAADEVAGLVCAQYAHKRDLHIRVREARDYVKEHLRMCAKMVQEQAVEGKCDHNKKAAEAAWVQKGTKKKQKQAEVKVDKITKRAGWIKGPVNPQHAEKKSPIIISRRHSNLSTCRNRLFILIVIKW